MPISKLSIFTGMVFVSIYAQEQVAKPRTSIWMYLGKHNFTCVHVVGNHMKMGHAYLIVYVQGFVSRLSTRSGGMKYSNLAFVLTTLIGSSVLRTFSFKFAKYIYNYNYNLSNLSQQDHEYMLNQGKVFLQAFTIADDTRPWPHQEASVIPRDNTASKALATWGKKIVLVSSRSSQARIPQDFEIIPSKVKLLKCQFLNLWLLIVTNIHVEPYLL